MKVCPLCGSKETNLYCENSDFLFETTEEKFKLIRCKKCDLIFMEKKFNPQELAKFYPKDYWEEKERKTENLYRKFVIYHHIFFVKKYLKNGNSILDIGCGDGLFLNELNRKKRYKAYGLEGFNKNVIAKNFTLIPEKIENVEKIPEEFDVITAFHVIEHLPDPDSFLEKVNKFLKENGKVILQLPNTDSIQAKIFKKRWTGIDIPRHLMNYNPENLRILLKKHNFEIERICHFSLRDSSPSIVSSLIPRFNPVYLNIKGRNDLFSTVKKFIYLIFVLSFQPISFLEALFRKGGIIFCVAKKKKEKK